MLRFITDAARKEGPFLTTNGMDVKRKLAIKHHSYSISSSNRSNTPTGNITIKHYLNSSNHSNNSLMLNAFIWTSLFTEQVFFEEK